MGAERAAKARSGAVSVSPIRNRRPSASRASICARADSMIGRCCAALSGCRCRFLRRAPARKRIEDRHGKSLPPRRAVDPRRDCAGTHWKHVGIGPCAHRNSESIEEKIEELASFGFCRGIRGIQLEILRCASVVVVDHVSRVNAGRFRPYRAPARRRHRHTSGLPVR